jgi:hypothetical protein
MAGMPFAYREVTTHEEKLASGEISEQAQAYG